MSETDETDEITGETEVVVRASTVAGVVEAIGGGQHEEVDLEESDPLAPVLEALADVLEGVERAMAEDERGRSRKMVRKYADREDLSGEAVGHHLRVLEAHGLVVQDGNRWRTVGEE